jgi:murein DD-endopeptidase MepM/ murein hydrolase activator NlpD
MDIKSIMYKLGYIVFLMAAGIFLLLNCSGTDNLKNNKQVYVKEAIISGEMIEMQEDLLDIEPGEKAKTQNSSFLHIAAKDGKSEIVQDIIKTGVDINSRDSAGNTALHYAVINGWFEIVDLLIKRGADINLKNKKGQTPLHFSALSIANVKKTVPSIIPVNGSFTSNFGIRRSPFSGNYQFHSGIDIAAPVGTPIRATANGTVIKHGWYGVLGNVIILQHENGLITVYGHSKEIKVRKGTKVQQGEVIAFVGTTGSSTGYHCHYAVFNNGIAVNPLPYLHVDGNQENRRSLDMITLLMGNHAIINSTDNTGKTALHYASMKSTDAAGLLISGGSALNIQDEYGMTPLHYAVVICDSGIVRKLLKAGAKANIRSKKTYTAYDGCYFKSGSTPLSIAMKRESLETAKILLKWGGIE